MLRPVKPDSTAAVNHRFSSFNKGLWHGALLEAGFLSHPAEGKKIRDAAYRREIAKAIVEGVLAYKRIVER